MNEPAVTLTDWLLALVCLVLVVRLRAAPRWSLFFAALGLSAFLGGLWHGYGHASEWLWRATLLAFGLGGAVAWHLGGRRLGRRWLWIPAAVLYLAHAAVVVGWRDDFLVAILHYLPPATFLLGVYAGCWLRGRRRRDAGVALGMVVIFLASGGQAAGLGIHPVHFDHNAVYHVILLVAAGLLAYGARGEIEDEAT